MACINEQGPPELRFTTKPQTSLDGHAKVTFCHDPDGTALELVEVLVQ